MSARDHTMAAHIYLGGDLELEVPIVVTFRPVPYVRATWDDPAEGGYAEVVSVTRTDGLQWHDGCDAAFDAWWEDGGETKAMKRAGECDAEARDYAADARHEMRLEMAREERANGGIRSPLTMFGERV